MPPWIPASASRRPRYYHFCKIWTFYKMASTEAILRLRPEFRVASERRHLGLYLMVKNDLDQDHGFRYIQPFVKMTRRPYVLIHGPLYIPHFSMFWCQFTIYLVCSYFCTVPVRVYPASAASHVYQTPTQASEASHVHVGAKRPKTSASGARLA